MTAIEQIIAIAEQLGWQVKTDTDKPNLVVFDFQQYTPHGQDFSFSVEMKGNDTDSLLQEVETYYEDFDPDYEAYLWIGTDGHGKNGRTLPNQRHRERYGAGGSHDRKTL